MLGPGISETFLHTVRIFFIYTWLQRLNSLLASISTSPSYSKQSRSTIIFPKRHLHQVQENKTTDRRVSEKLNENIYLRWIMSVNYCECPGSLRFSCTAFAHLSRWQHWVQDSTFWSIFKPTDRHMYTTTASLFCCLDHILAKGEMKWCLVFEVRELQQENEGSLRKLQETAEQFEWLCQQQRYWMCCVKRWAFPPYFETKVTKCLTVKTRNKKVNKNIKAKID